MEIGSTAGNERIQGWKRLGEHEMWYEPDTRFVRFTHRGTITEADVIEMTAFFLEKSAGDPTFLLADNTKAMGYTAEARRAFKESQMMTLGVYLGVFGSPMAVRVMMNLMVKAMVLIPGINLFVHATADEPAARAWLTEERRAYLARKAKT